MQPFACEKKRFLWNSKCAGITSHTWPLTSTLTLSTRWMHADPESIMCKFGGGETAVCLVEEAICAKCLQTDRRTSRHCISSLEWAKNVQKRGNESKARQFLQPYIIIYSLIVRPIGVLCSWLYSEDVRGGELQGECAAVCQTYVDTSRGEPRRHSWSHPRAWLGKYLQASAQSSACDI